MLVGEGEFMTVCLVHNKVKSNCNFNYLIFVQQNHTIKRYFAIKQNQKAINKVCHLDKLNFQIFLFHLKYCN